MPLKNYTSKQDKKVLTSIRSEYIDGLRNRNMLGSMSVNLKKGIVNNQRNKIISRFIEDLEDLIIKN